MGIAHIKIAAGRFGGRRCGCNNGSLVIEFRRSLLDAEVGRAVVGYS
jgi:hypothetical protein